ncbi:Serine/threonine protein phosphatase PP1 isozyme 4 [Tritrichomonas foetus]|uniref:Serine/threonine-protein phosphatase n=1 Tax=Tritrichomonas foetus TaxID=1144522 RepID=A0A1J4KNM1_9EUKA|nr:Serine/threonine protein phosphatase PP1 isozyme 4 [Tritrichomonas foetus]|eukprot:OHT12871.1 Serine/threonine protein phosphatase PP1 isozyme 4 [Tritrichomonas foetus]
MSLTNEERKDIENIYNELYSKRDLAQGEYVPLDENKLRWICDKSIEYLSRDNILLDLNAPISVVGDVHGQFSDAMKFIEIGGNPATTKYLFLGDYVDRGFNSIETITALLCLKLLYPQNVYMLRGNHETEEISQLYGFYEECEMRYTTDLWKKYNEVFTYLPLAAVISQRIFCVHGGISQHMQSIKDIEDIKRPLKTIEEDSFISDLLWADPSPDITGYQSSERGTSYTFGQDVAEEFLRENDYDLICRAHQVVQDGYEFPFYPGQSVVTVFSAPNYCQDFGNKGAMLKITEALTCSFEFVNPPDDMYDSDRDRPLTPAGH